MAFHAFWGADKWDYEDGICYLFPCQFDKLTVLYLGRALSPTCPAAGEQSLRLILDPLEYCCSF